MSACDTEMQKKQLQLMCFCVTGRVEECRRLLDAGVDLYSKNEYGVQALHFAVIDDRYVIPRLILNVSEGP